MQEKYDAYAQFVAGQMERGVKDASICAVRVRVGATVNKQETVAVVVLKEHEDVWVASEKKNQPDDAPIILASDPEEAGELALEAAQDAGWGEEFSTARAYAAGVIGKRRVKGRTLTRSVDLNPSPSGAALPSDNNIGFAAATAIDKLTRCVVQMADRNGQALAQVSQALADSQGHNVEMFNGMLEAREDALETQALSDSRALEMYLEQANMLVEQSQREAEAEGDDYMQEGLGIVQTLLSKMGGKPSLDDILANEDLIDQALDHPRAEEVFGEAMARKMARDKAREDAANQQSPPAEEQPSDPAPAQPE